MHLTACVNIHDLPLQLLIRLYPDWKTLPVAIVTPNNHRNFIITANQLAIELGVRKGMLYKKALSLIPNLKTKVISHQTITHNIKIIKNKLLYISPNIEEIRESDLFRNHSIKSLKPFSTSLIFWIDISGLHYHYQFPYEIGTKIQQILKKEKLSSTVAIGYSRMGTYLMSKNIIEKQLHDCSKKIIVISKIADEKNFVQKTPIDFLPLETGAYEILKKLNITTVGDFIEINYTEILTHFGFQISRIHHFIKNNINLPIQESSTPKQYLYHTYLSHVETDVTRLITNYKILLDKLLYQLKLEDSGTEKIMLQLFLEDGSVRHESIETSRITRHRKILSDLLTIKLVSIKLISGVEALSLRSYQKPLPKNQSDLFHNKLHLNYILRTEILSEIQNEFGYKSVLQATLHKSHIPENQFSWHPITKPPLIKPPLSNANKPLIRRLLHKPINLNKQFFSNRKCFFYGPFLISSCWWWIKNNYPIRRAYYFVTYSRGKIEWIYYDYNLNSWNIHGWIE